MSAGIGLIGLGSIAETHLAALAELRGEGFDSDVVGWVGRAERADTLGLPPDRGHTVAELLRNPDVDLVVDVTPSNLHAEHTLAALRAGKGVVIEKPLTTDAAAASEIVEAADSAGLFGAVISQRRFEPQHQYLAEQLASGRLGDVVAASISLPWWRDDAYFAAAPWRSEPPGGSVLLNQGIHSVDLLLWLLGEVTDVAGFSGSRWRPGSAFDTTVGIVRFASGALATVLASTATAPGSAATLSIHTTLGTASFSQSETTAWTFTDVAPPPAAPAIAAGASDPKAIGHVGHTNQWRDILTAWRDGRPPAVTLADGLRAVEVCLALESSR